METKHFNIIRELYLNNENRNLLKCLLEYLETKPFNIVRELYLKNENRNLLKCFLKYLDNDERGLTVVSYLKGQSKIGVDICCICFKKCNGKFHKCIALKKYIGICKNNGVCKNCHFEHIIKYTGKCEIYNASDNVRISFRHSCKDGNFFGSCSMSICDKVYYLKKGIYKENIMDYVGYLYSFKWNLTR